MQKVFRNPIWENGDKKRIICEIEFTRDDGTIELLPASIAEGSADWDRLVELYKDTMDKIWDDHINSRQERENKMKEGEKRNEARIQQEKLFAKKLEIFEMEHVKESKNRKLKTMIRKAKSETEAIVFASILVKEELDKASV